MKPLVLVALLAFGAGPASADELRRVAVIVGANRGALGRESLRYSYADAMQVASVLVEAGQFAKGDVHVMQDPEPQAVLDELDAQLQALGSSPESLLLFYYSGHADSAALYPAGHALSFARLRERLESRSATVRIGIIDACSGGGWTGAKGMYPTPPFAVDVPLELTGEGSVLIASSSGVEKAHESEQINGSFFTHHLVAALRGAADTRGDGVVTLTDAFAYAKERTVRDSAAVADPQHPSFAMNLRGRSDLPLTRVAQAKTQMELSESEGPLQLIHLGSGLVVLEVPPGKRTIKLSVPPGHYLVRRQVNNGNYSREITVEPDKSVSLDEHDLTLSPFPHEGSKIYASGVDSWPLSVNDRPLTLLSGMAEASVGLLIEDDPAFNAFPSTPTVGGFGRPTALAPGLRYGVTDRLTLGIGAPGGICIGSNNCEAISANLALTGMYSFWNGGPVEVAALASAGYDGTQNFPLGAGATVRFGGGRLVSLQLTGMLTREVTTVSNPSGWWIVRAGALATLQAAEPLSFDLGADLYDQLLSGAPQPRTIPLVAGATWAVAHRLDLRAQLQFRNLLTSGQYGPGDYRQFGFFVVFRP
ncbi:MAG TPA: caspase family protein [Myxococcales bacterium]|nr:caspase family protein [Myxococcales bacterium]